MRSAGTLLLMAGALAGALVGLGLLFGIPVPGLPWLLVVGLVKLALLGSLGLMASGAVLLRLARRADERARLASHNHEQ